MLDSRSIILHCVLRPGFLHSGIENTISWQVNQNREPEKAAFPEETTLYLFCHREKYSLTSSPHHLRIL